MIRNAEKALKFIDIYGQNIQLNFKGQNSYKTVFGGILSLAFFTLICVACWFFGKELILKESPQVISSERPVDSPKRISIRPDNLIIMLGLANNSSVPFIDPSIFTVRAVQETTVNVTDSKTGVSTKKLIEVKKEIRLCTNEDVGMFSIKSFFNQVDIASFYCFDGFNEDIYMEGDFNTGNFSQIYAYFDKCQNSTQSPIICKPQEVIDQTLLYTKLQIYMSDHIVEPSNYLEPFKDRGISLYAITSSLLPQEIELFFTNYYIETDVGLIIKQIETQQSFVFVQQTVTPFFSDDNVLGRVLFRLQKQKENLMQRNYLKFADFLAQMGGFLKTMIVFGSIISAPISKLYLYKSAVDEIFQFQSNKNVNLVAKNIVKISEPASKNSLSSPLKKTQRNKTNQKQKVNQNVINMNQKVNLQNVKANMNSNQSELQIINQSLSPHLSCAQWNSFCSQNHDNTKKYQASSNVFHDSSKPNIQQFGVKRVIESAKDYFLKTHQIIKYKFMNYFVHAFFPKAKSIVHKFKLVNEGVSKIQDHLDVMYILNKLLEIDKIKYILLNKDQLKLFEYIPKPVISDETLDNDQDSIKSSMSDAAKNQIINEGIYENKIQLEANTPNIQQMAQRNQNNFPQFLSSNQNQQINKENNQNKFQFGMQRRKGSTNFLQNNVYSQFGKKQTEEQIIQQAYDGLSNILQQRKFSKIDEKLVELIDPNLITQIQREQQIFEQSEESLTQIPLNAFLSNQLQKASDNEKYELKKQQLPLNKLHVIKDSSSNQSSSFNTNSSNPKNILQEGIEEINIPNKVKKFLIDNQNQAVDYNKKQDQEYDKSQQQLTSSQETNQICGVLKEDENPITDIQLVYQSPIMKQILSKQFSKSFTNQ
ncbi:transmembrane protein, putative (macronuclear) [Tetrahymena thermophila SB210]|uniref:Transmembrane protein, putative n=1 Tax=Tetrahymena thermophila (strain SB210) TaxID=312017 RepID=Q22M00_TETTS|nr:transmembrane protein, putative [Tetrahymena thermophila SB210]EAR86306.1 transmembrane protein, putative [Tetrahymena thermophila SB210]|eukprot:XP_977220.1 transmembrane protein, putative [Tetrahymena thermophila SB210]